MEEFDEASPDFRSFCTLQGCRIPCLKSMCEALLLPKTARKAVLVVRVAREMRDALSSAGAVVSRHTERSIFDARKFAKADNYMYQESGSHFICDPRQVEGLNVSFLRETGVYLPAEISATLDVAPFGRKVCAVGDPAVQRTAADASTDLEVRPAKVPRLDGSAGGQTPVIYAGAGGFGGGAASGWAGGGLCPKKSAALQHATTGGGACAVKPCSKMIPCGCGKPLAGEPAVYCCKCRKAGHHHRCFVILRSENGYPLRSETWLCPMCRVIDALSFARVKRLPIPPVLVTSRRPLKMTANLSCIDYLAPVKSSSGPPRAILASCFLAGDSTYSLRPVWPPKAHLAINGQGIDLTRVTGAERKDSGSFSRIMDITSLLTRGVNTFELSFPPRPGSGFGDSRDTYYMVIIEIESISHAEIVTAIADANKPKRSQALACMASAWKGGHVQTVERAWYGEAGPPLTEIVDEAERRRRLRGDSSDDIAQLVSGIELPVRDPLTLMFMECAVRGSRCQHLQCFDLHAYLKHNLRCGEWRCPYCQVYTTPIMLWPDPVQNEALKDLKNGVLKRTKAVSPAATGDSNGGSVAGGAGGAAAGCTTVPPATKRPRDDTDSAEPPPRCARGWQSVSHLLWHQDGSWEAVFKVDDYETMVRSSSGLSRSQSSASVPDQSALLRDRSVSSAPATIDTGGAGAGAGAGDTEVIDLVSSDDE